MGRSKLFELCRREFEKTPGELILEARISAARELLQNPKLTTAEIAQAVGYPDASYFCQRFRRSAAKRRRNTGGNAEKPSGFCHRSTVLRLPERDKNTATPL